METKTHRTDLRTRGHGKGKGGMGGDSSVETYTLLYVKQTASGNFLYDSGNANQGSMTT